MTNIAEAIESLAQCGVERRPVLKRIARVQRERRILPTSRSSRYPASIDSAAVVRLLLAGLVGVDRSRGDDTAQVYGALVDVDNGTTLAARLVSLMQARDDRAGVFQELRFDLDIPAATLVLQFGQSGMPLTAVHRFTQPDADQDDHYRTRVRREVSLPKEIWNKIVSKLR